MDYRDLLEAYRMLWTNRTLPVKKDEYTTLISSIEKEMKDEMTHPRLRKTSTEKFHSSVTRIISSSLNNKQKVQLIELHISVIERIRNFEQ
ncbi:hypothetical protein [Metabacillus litoralis]|uniref:hypothetical protein n=1 Tax=Metabacillus litoralis TaxID=152268 RepID=UPI001CFDB027|nr:hypothetical protein [Metabacillus litoralis]